MNTPDQPPVEEDGTMKRRVIMQGAAWTIPIIATATAAPLASASPPCPSVKNPQQWSAQVIQGGFASGANSWGENDEWVSDADAARGQGSQTKYYLTTTFEVVAGTTYDFIQRIASGHVVPPGGWSYPQDMSLEVGGSVIFTASTAAGRAQADLLPDGEYRNYPAGPFQPTTSGTVVMTYIFSFDSTLQFPDVNDSITMELPTIVCT